MKIRVPDEIHKMKADGLSPLEIYIQNDSEPQIARYISQLFDIDIASDEMKQIQRRVHEVRYNKYYLLKEQGLSAEEVAVIIHEDGITDMRRWGIVKTVFDVTLMKTKEIILRADGVANSLGEYQANIAVVLENVIELFEMEETDIIPLFNCAYPDGLGDGDEGDQLFYAIYQTIKDELPDWLLDLVLNATFPRHAYNNKILKDQVPQIADADKKQIRSKLLACGWNELKAKLLTYDK